MNGKDGGPAPDQGTSEPAREELGREPGETAGDSARESAKPSPGEIGRGRESPGDGPDAIDLDSVHDRAS